METENKNKSLKWLIGLLAFLFIALAIYTVRLYQESQETTANLEIQKMDIENELEELLVNYNNAISENKHMDKELIAAKERIESLLDSVKDAQVNVDLIRRYRSEIGKLKTEKEHLFKRVDSLQYLATKLTIERDSTATMLDETYKLVDSISLQNEALSRMVAKGAALQLTRLKADGVVMRNSGKIVETDRAKRSDKIRTCFTINANEIAETGDKLLFIQVINPKNNVLGEKSTVQFDQNILTYSATSNVYYENKELDVCVLVNAQETDLVAGNYTVNVFDGPRMVSTSTVCIVVVFFIFAV